MPPTLVKVSCLIFLCYIHSKKPLIKILIELNIKIKTQIVTKSHSCQFTQDLPPASNKKLTIIASTAFCTFCKNESSSFTPTKKLISTNSPALSKKCTFKWNKWKKQNTSIPNAHMPFNSFLIILWKKTTQTATLLSKMIQSINRKTWKIKSTKKDQSMKSLWMDRVWMNRMESKKLTRFQ